MLEKQNLAAQRLRLIKSGGDFVIREEALERFHAEEKMQIEEARTAFADHLMKHLELLKKTVLQGIQNLSQEVEKQKKTDLVFFYFSLLKINVLSRKYTISLLAQDSGWYLDQNSIEVTFSLDFLFEPLEQLWDYLDQKSKEYVGTVNRYDVQHIIFTELDSYNKTIANVLRFMVQGLEQESCFKEIPKAETWEVRWGEYRDETQLLLQVDRAPKGLKEWKKQWRKVNQEADRLVFSYWYQGRFSHSDCSEFDLKYITFEQCHLSRFNFDRADLMSAKFKDTTLNGCSFQGSNLQDANFTGSNFQAVDFTGADLTNAVFSGKSLFDLKLTPEQLDVILVKEE